MLANKMKKENATLKQLIQESIDKAYKFYDNVPDYKTGRYLEREYVKQKVGKLAEMYFK